MSNNDHTYGLEILFAEMPAPSVTEEGIFISGSQVERLDFKIYEPRTIDFGNAQFPYNLYNNQADYKPFPNIGDNIR